MLDLLAKVRTIGPPTWFLTLSADDNGWTDVSTLVSLEECGTGETSNMSDVCKNPVICAKQFYRRWRAIMRWLKASRTLGDVTDHFARVEFQARGSPHLHMFLWVKHTPNLKTEEGRKMMPSFLDRHVSTNLPEDGPDRELVRKYQTHRHTDYCTRKTGICRFKYPKKPCRTTSMLDPLNMVKGIEFYETQRSSESIFVNSYNRSSSGLARKYGHPACRQLLWRVRIRVLLCL